MYVRGITILPREDSVMGKSLKKLIKGQCPLRDMATAWELSLGLELYILKIMGIFVAVETDFRSKT